MEKTITLHDKTFKPFIPNSDLEKAIDAVAEKINADYANAQDIPVLLCILNGSIVFTGELMKRLTFPAELVSTKLSSYEGTHSTGEIRVDIPLTGSVRGKRVIVLEDIVDTGATMVALVKLLKEAGATDVKICTMLVKPEVFQNRLPLDYVAMEIPNRFIVGFGLDYDQLGRNLKDIYVLDH